MSSPLQFAVNIAQQAGEKLLSYFRFEGIPSDFKADHTAVTQADMAADRLICQAIREQFPQDNILSEESNPGHFFADSPTWVIDPLDGTANFSLGLPIWGVSIARLIDGVPDIGVLNFPMTNELYAAQRGGGVTLNGIPLHSIQTGEHTVTPFFSCCSRTIRRYIINLPYKARVLGASTHTFANVARGSAVAGLQLTPKIWDFAAGWLIVEEAGKVLEVMHGPNPFPLDPSIDYSKTVFPIILGVNAEYINEVRQGITRR
jgi:myo-inositol-1(or 4)-monophosphatase